MSTDTTQPADGIAVIGMAGKFPGAPNLAAYWENLRNGVESITHFDPGELEVSPAISDNPQYVRARGIMADVDLFDADFFGLHPREAEYTDPQHRLLLETAWEALESAGCDSERFAGAIGVFAGCSLNTYLLHNLASRPAFLAEFHASQQMGAHPAKTPIAPATRSGSQPADSSACHAVSSRSRCCGSVYSASRGCRPKKSASKRSTSGRMARALT